MSNRANVFLHERGVVTTFAHRWGADSLLYRLAFGPTSFLDEVLRSPWAVENRVLWAEGAARVDLDHRTLRYFGGAPFGGNPAARRVGLAYTRLAWRGWDVAHADGGLGELTGQPRAAAAVEGEDVTRVTSDAHYVVTLDNGQSAGFVVRSPRVPPPGESRLPAILWGPEAVSALERGPMLTSLPKEAHTRGGAIVDRAARALRIWHYGLDESVLSALRDRLPEWEIAFLAEGYPAQVAVAEAASHDCLVDPEVILDDIFVRNPAFEKVLLPRLAVQLVRAGFAPGRLLRDRGLESVSYEAARPWMVACARGAKYAASADRA